MDLRFSCPQCGVRHSVAVCADAAVVCSGCGQRWQLAREEAGSERVQDCVICRCPHLFLRKDFPKRLGAAIVLAGIVASCITWHWYRPILTFAVLFATAALDLIVYLVVGDLLVCYRCGAEYRGSPADAQRIPFDLETAERYRQEQIRLKGG